MSVFEWLNNQLLRMQWLSDLVRWGVEALGLDMNSRLGGSVHFFVYDVVKIFILLSVLIFGISWVQSYFPPERTRRILGSMSGVSARLAGAHSVATTPIDRNFALRLLVSGLHESVFTLHRLGLFGRRG